MSQVVKTPCNKLLFNLQGLQYMNSTGFGVLASVAMEEKDKGEKQICFCNMHPTILNTYTIFGMEQVWPQYPTIEAALASLAEGKRSALEEPEEEVVNFPLIRSCTHCNRPSNFPKPGNYKCPYCSTIHQLDNKGNLKQITRPPRKKMESNKFEAGVTDEIDISVPSDPYHLSRVRDFIFSFLPETFNEEVRSSMVMAVDEAFANAIEHAHKNDRSKKVQMHIEVSLKRVAITVKDSGENTFNKIVQKKQVNQDQIKKTGRGMGLLLIKQMMDEVNLKPTETWGTAVTMIKYAPSEGEEK